MCIAIIKPAGVKSPADKNLEQCFNTNRDGAGFCYAKNGKIHIRKGFMTFQDFLKEYTSCYDMFDLDNSTVFIHFRISTHGGISQGNTHPFPMVDSFDDMKKTEFVIKKGGHAAMHNGILRIKASETASDTMHYLKNLYGLDYWGDKRVQKLIQLSSVGSKLAFLSTSGKFQYYGDWIIDNEVFYSNTSYVIRQQYFNFRDCEPISYGMEKGDSWDKSSIGKKNPKEPRCSDCIFATHCYRSVDDASGMVAYPECFYAGDPNKYTHSELEMIMKGEVELDEEGNIVGLDEEVTTLDQVYSDPELITAN